VKTVLRIGAGTGLLCGTWMLVMGLTGWYKQLQLLNLFWLVVPIQIGVLVWGLRQSAATERYARQVGIGTFGSVVGGAILFLVSLLYTGVLFPKYFEEVCAVQKEIWKAEGRSDAMIQQAVAAAAPFQTSFWSAFFGFVGAAVTGLLVSLVLAAFIRKK
jgi:hypothetical protein